MARAETALSKLPLAAKIGIGAGLLAVTFVAYFVIFYGDLASSIKAAESKEKQLREQLAQARKAEFEYQKDLNDLAERQQRQRELNKILPTSTEYPAFLSSIQNVANVAGVALTAWTPNPEVTQQFYARVPMKLELVGRYHQVAKFFYGVGQLDRITNVENIVIKDPKEQGEDIIVRVEALATAFRAVDEAQAAAADKRGAAPKKGGH
ncbi:MAG TPA: type 4a pilus biogenesis protein PilO [Polyangiaceae bacterium]|jgi:type IV pilus assembly protein PilO|nr:type 4a pilus biogenesis protein PilO [Polyangiaceae bacterium]